VSVTKSASYVICAVSAAVAGIFLSVQLGVGSNDVGAGFPLVGFTACFLGGASLSGGRGSFVGAVVGALFLTLLVNIMPLLGIASEWSDILTGVLTVVAVASYSLQHRTGRGSRDRAAPRAQAAPPGETSRSTQSVVGKGV
jgi:ribose transport system ATP-binding protein